jgi:hypothetical protein
MDRFPGRCTRIALVALLVGGLGMAGPSPAAASAVCPPPPDELAGLISPDALDRGPLSEEFEPIYGPYAEAAANCWGGTEISVSGFVAGPEGLGGTRSYRIEPQWIADAGHWLSTNSRVDPDSGPVGPFFRVAVPPTMEAKFTRFDGQWVRVSGHFHDPAAETCALTFGTPEPGLVPTPEQAIEICRTSFVLTSVDALSLPSTDAALANTARTASPDPTGLLIALIAGGAFVLVLRRSGSRAGRRR